MPNKMTRNDVELWMKYVDEDGEECFEKIHRLTEEEAELTFSPEEGETEEEDATLGEVMALCGKTLREKYFLEGMVHAYERVLLIDFDDEGDE